MPLIELTRKIIFPSPELAHESGILAIGGIMGTTLGVGAMKRLPLWLPKLMVSVIGLACYSPLLDPATKSRDITIMPTLADLWCVDNVTRL